MLRLSRTTKDTVARWPIRSLRKWPARALYDPHPPMGSGFPHPPHISSPPKNSPRHCKSRYLRQPARQPRIRHQPPKRPSEKNSPSEKPREERVRLGWLRNRSRQKSDSRQDSPTPPQRLCEHYQELPRGLDSRTILHANDLHRKVEKHDRTRRKNRSWRKHRQRNFVPSR